ncbi:unnamed protein product [Paramecium pentaurelia]|uniref:Cyclic nucleotide-binding domain-containing protein n=1 Tax=Paramecium pentaurelia TaxID=43138 RepID=A0A8S1XAX7_9CILI|nr:unnamed protein product [Paramecium pentaurelia]
MNNQTGKYIKLNLFSKLKTIMKRKGQPDTETIRTEWSQMIADNSRIESRKHYQQRKRLYYIATVNSVFMRNQYFIQNLPEQEDQFIQQEQPPNQSEESKMIETVQNLDTIKKIVKVRLPTDFVLVIWNIYIMILIFSQMLLIPLVLSFDINNEGVSIYDWVVNGCFYIDILLQFNTAIYIDGNLVQDRIVIVKEYLKLWFWIDLISSFPYDIIFDSPEMQSKAQVIKLLRFIKFIKVIRLLRALKLKKIFGRIEEYISVMESLFQFTQMLKLIILILCIAHWCACVWNLFIDGEDSNWAAKYQIKNEDWTVKYMTSIYYSMTTMITVGYGDVHAYSYQEMIYAIFLMLLASAVFGYTTNIVMELFSNQYDKFIEKEQNIKSYLKRKKIDVSLTSRVTSYLEWLQFSYAKSQQHESTVIDSLSANLKSEVICLINSKIIEKIPFFETFSKDLLSNIAYRLQEKVFGPEEIIFEQGSLGDEMYCIVNGSIQVKYFQTRIANLGKDEIFGEICLFSEQTRSATIITEDFVNLLVLKKEPFLMIIKQLQNDLEKYHQIKYYLEIEQDYSVLDIRCYICQEFHLALNCPMAHLIIDKQILFLQPHKQLCPKPRFKIKHKHSYKYLRDQTHLRALKKLHQKLMKLHLLGRQSMILKSQQQKIDNNFMDSEHFDIDQVKQFEFYVTKGNVDDIILSINLNADIKLKQIQQEKESRVQQKKMQLSRVRKAILHNPFLDVIKKKNDPSTIFSLQVPQQQQQIQQICSPSPLQTKRNRMNQVKNMRQHSQSQLMKAQSRQDKKYHNSQFKYKENNDEAEIEFEESIQKIRSIKINNFPQEPYIKPKRTSSFKQRKTRKLSLQEKRILTIIKQAELGLKNCVMNYV